MAKKSDSGGAVLATDVHLYDDDHAPEVFIAGTPAVELPEWASAILGVDHPALVKPEPEDAETV